MIPLLIVAGWVTAAIFAAPLIVKTFIAPPGGRDWREEAEAFDWFMGLFFALLVWPLIVLLAPLVGLVKRAAGVEQKPVSEDVKP